SKMRVITNLNADADDKSPTTLEASWNAQNATPIEGDKYEYQTTLKAYDSLGDSHDIQIYYDPDPSATTASTWEFIVTCNPEEDNRTGAHTALTVDGDDGVGMLARGKIVFDPSDGVITDINLDKFNIDGSDYTIAGGNWTTGDEETDLTDGYFTISPDFIDGSSPLTISLDFGAQCTDPLTPTWTPDSLSTTQYAASSSTNFQSSNGYGVGDLQSIAVEKDGIINGQYSNGQSAALFRLTLAKFHSTQGLGKIGGNLYEETAQSGSAITNRPGTNGLGTILANSLEQSNVDIANEFVKMITTQRGYQANSRIITVTDQMLADVIAMKR
ncbi:MAG: flagellar hook-basal body complex protein, partial [Thermodesulfobacteriota bacterium]|nr:flagellar hook-basal body complex protein [Thermodesulfobacteriota bacterium]